MSSNKKKLIFTIIAIITASVIVISLIFNKKQQIEIETSKGIVLYHVEMALTQKQQAKGLMNRSKLPHKNGMIFIFRTPHIARMWMKNTLIPLDMVFFDINGWVTSVHKNARPQDLSVISSEVPVIGVLEINAGEAEHFNIIPGSRIHIEKIK